LDQDGRRGKQHGDEAPDKDYAGVSGEGLWSDGTTLWVAKGGDEQIHAYDLATKSRVAGKDFHSVGGFAQGIWSDGKTMWVAIGHQIHAFEMPPFSINEATPAPVTPASAATPASEPEAAPFARKPREDFDNLKLPATHGSAEGMWSDGTTIWLVETTEDRLYAFNMSTKLREGTKYFNTLAAADNTSPESNWSDGTTMWVAETDRIFAYSMSTKKRVPSEDFDTLRPAGNVGVEGIWSDGVTLWTADHDHDKLFAYNLDTKERVPDEDFNTLDDAGNNWPIAIWSNGATMWVSDWTDDKLYAYDMDSKQRVDDLDFNTLDAAGNNTPEGIWANRETMWVRDSEDNKLYAYQMPAVSGPAPAPTATPSTPAAGEIGDRLALMAFYNTMGGRRWERQANWLSDQPLDKWQGVGTDTDGRVVHLNLGRNNLTGNVPPEVVHLTALKKLYLGDNDLSGSIPTWLGSTELAELETLDLSDNRLSGEMRDFEWLANLPKLRTLWFEGNEFTGCVPWSLIDLVPGVSNQLAKSGCPIIRQELEGLYESMGGQYWNNKTNWLTGRPINTWYGISTDGNGRITQLKLGNNNLRGEIPWEPLSKLEKLEHLDLGGNNLSGTIPPQLSRLENLEYLDLSRNQLAGVIPEELAELKQLRRDGLRLYGHEFAGCVPLHLKGKLAESYFAPVYAEPEYDIVDGILDLVRVYFPDYVQSFMSDLLRHEKLAEAIKGIKPDKGLRQIVEASDDFTIGGIVKGAAGFGAILDVIDILTQDWFIRWVRGSAEATYGLGAPPCAPEPSSPATALDRQSLDTDRIALLAIRDYYLNNDKNQYDHNHDRRHNSYAFDEYPCPKWWDENRMCTGDFNWLTQGHDPSKWHGVTVKNGRVVGLEITDRLLEGGMPAQVGDLGALKRLNLSRNRLSGPIPKALGNLVNLEHLSLNGKSDLCGPNYSITGNCSADRLSGEIPKELGNLTKLKVLHLHENNFEGGLPHELGNAANLAPNKESRGPNDPKLREVNFRQSGLTGCLPPKLQGNFDTPIGAKFVAHLARILAFTAVGKFNPLLGAGLSTLNYFTGGKLTSIVDWANDTTAKFLTRQGAFHSDLGDVALYCDSVPAPKIERSFVSGQRSTW